MSCVVGLDWACPLCVTSLLTSPACWGCVSFVHSVKGIWVVMVSEGGLVWGLVNGFVVEMGLV